MMLKAPPSRAALVLRVKLLCVAAGLVSFVLSVVLWFTGHHDQGIFVGLWVPSIFGFGALLLAGESAGGRHE
ncbi:MAG TPA: hypothetical protein VMU14_05740 [Acidimicrobiales bacterium]|nr:hypothetical protein [Acidimicrobiales bacterium]